MAGTSIWGKTPRESVEAECDRRGADTVVSACVDLLAGRDVDPGLVRALGGPGADKFFDGRPHDDAYWLRVWGARGLLWVWHDDASAAVESALSDEHWRVREMAAKVAGRHLLGDAVPALERLQDDPVPRVRSAGAKAMARITGAGA